LVAIGNANPANINAERLEEPLTHLYIDSASVYRKTMMQIHYHAGKLNREDILKNEPSKKRGVTWAVALAPLREGFPRAIRTPTGPATI
jgi:hypothetical protein